MSEEQQRIEIAGYDPVAVLPVKLSTTPKHAKACRGSTLSELGELIERLAPALYARGLNDKEMGRTMLPDFPVAQSRQYAFRWRVRHGKPANRKGSPRKKVS